MFAVNTLAALFVMFVISGASLQAPVAQLTEMFLVSFVFSNCIGIPATLVMSRLGAGLLHRLGSPVSWLFVLLTFVVVAIAGSFLAVGILVLVGYLPWSETAGWLAGSVRISVLATLTFGVAVSVYETMRARLEATTLALRTKERDEADARRLAAEAQLSALEARVQPHFLFNTLNSIAALIPSDPQGAERMVGRLSTLLRANLDATSPLVPLTAELAAVRDYLEIERVRFDARLRYSLPDGRWRDEIRVPRLSIQTLVENSVKYAVSPRRLGATIAVDVEMRGDRLQVCVCDDGPGFDTQQWPQRHGLALLRERLDTLYGTAAALTVDGTPGHCAVRFEVPLATTAAPLARASA